MNLFYGLLALMLLGTLGLLFIPFLKTNKTNYPGFFLVGGLSIAFAICIYYFTHDHQALRGWLTQGKEHYELQVQFNNLGGIDGIIAHLKTKLHDDPRDAQGWFILGKMYLLKDDSLAARDALQHAQELQPDNPEIKTILTNLGQKS